MASTNPAVAAAANAGASSFHVRSISLPSRSHPLSVRVEEGLHKLKTWATSELLLQYGQGGGRASSPAAELLCAGLQALEEMHECVEELLRLPRTQRALARRQHEKWAAEELDSSVRLLDVCQSTRDAVSSIKEQAQRLQSALRRTRKVAGSVDGQLQYAFVQSRKKAHKEGSKCSKSLKQLMESKHVVAGPLSDDHEVEDGDMSVALKAMEDLREITVVVLRSTACFLCNKPSRIRWFPAASCTGTDQFEKVEASLRSIFQRKPYNYSGDKIAESFEKKVEEAQRGLQSLEVGMGGLELCLDSMFRRLIQNRVSLLNILSP